MYLKHLSIHGFKSFAKKSELEFNTAITAIVGPNGSGKSNVAEAFRFVLGEQSVKSLRGKRGEDLIWGGTAEVSRSNRAGVTITLDNSEKVFPVDFDEVIIERVVHRDGQNEYLVNGSKVRLKDIQEILAAANIGPTGHHIISQGEADRILSASPKERREMIEDALGLKVFQLKKQESEKKLKKTQDNIEKVESLRREVAPHLKFLERQIQKMARAVSLRKELSVSYKEYLKREDVYLAALYDTTTAQLRAAEREAETHTQSLAVMKKEIAAATESFDDTQLKEAQAALRAVQDEHQAAVRTVGRLEGEIAFIQRRIAAEKAAEEKQAYKPVPYQDVEAIIATVEREVTKASQKNDASFLQRSLSDVVHTLKRWLQSTQTARPKSATSEYESELEALQQDKAKHEQTLKKFAAQEEEARAGVTAQEQEREDSFKHTREAEQQSFALQTAVREAEHQVQRYRNELQVIEREREDFKRELQEAVVMIGREAAGYLQYEVVVNDVAISKKDMLAEERAVQQQRRRDLEKIKIRLEELGGVDTDVEKEYKDAKERDEFLAREIADLEESVQTLQALIGDLTTQLNERFDTGIEKISREFQRFFALMFGGGEAALQRQVIATSSDDEESEEETKHEGIDLSVKLPNKRISGLGMLSGGERALTSIALIFAMSQVNPPLFIILDETDAALDEANSRRYGDMIQALAEKSQLILITHNRETMSRAGVLYGVTMRGDGVSKLLSVKFAEAAAVAK